MMHRLTIQIRSATSQAIKRPCTPVHKPRSARHYAISIQSTVEPSLSLLPLYKQKLEDNGMEVKTGSPDISKLKRDDFATIRYTFRSLKHWGNDEKTLQLLEDMKVAGHVWGVTEFNEYFMIKLYQARYQDILDCYQGEFLASSFKPSVRTISILLATYIQLGKTKDAIDLVRNANSRWKISPNIQDFDRTTKRCIPHMTWVINAGQDLIEQYALGNTSALNANLIRLLRDKRVKDSKRIYDQARSNGKLDITTYSILIKGFVEAQSLVDAKIIFQDLQADGVSPDAAICSHMLTIYAHNRDMLSAEQVVRSTVLAGHTIDITIYSQLIRVYFKAREIHKALRAFDTVVKDPRLKVNNILVNTMIDGLVINKEMEVAKLLFEQMLRSDIEPDLITFNTLLKGFTQAGDFMAVQGVISDIKKHGLSPDTVTFTTLIDAVFSTKQPQSLDDAMRFLHSTGMEPNVYTFNAMINGWIRNNRMDEAEKTLELMRSSIYKLRPTIHTYTNLIQGYVTQMNLSKAWQFFQESIAMDCQPDRATFNYIIKVLIEFDRLEDSVESLLMMRKMDRNPTTDTWRILLNECMRKRNWAAGSQVVQALDESGFVIQSEALQRAYATIKHHRHKN